MRPFLLPAFFLFLIAGIAPSFAVPDRPVMGVYIKKPVSPLNDPKFRREHSYKMVKSGTVTDFDRVWARVYGKSDAIAALDAAAPKKPAPGIGTVGGIGKVGAPKIAAPSDKKPQIVYAVDELKKVQMLTGVKIKFISLPDLNTDTAGGLSISGAAPAPEKTPANTAPPLISGTITSTGAITTSSQNKPAKDAKTPAAPPELNNGGIGPVGGIGKVGPE